MKCGCKTAVVENAVKGGECAAVADNGVCKATSSGSPGESSATYALCCVCLPTF